MKPTRKILAIFVVLALALGSMASPASAAGGQPSSCNAITATQPNQVIGSVAYWWGTSGADSIRPASGSWTIVSISGGAGNDTICGDPYKTNFLYGDTGSDVLYGGSNADHLVGGPSYDWASGLAGSDTYDAEARIDNSDTFHGGSGYDKIINCTTAPGCPPMGYWTSVAQFNP